jgi:group I intron endonuclease
MGSMYSIYRITNNFDGRVYIGYTTEQPASMRFTRHKRLAKTNSMTHLHCAMRKYGVEHFSFDVLCWGEDNEAGLKIAEPLLIGLFPHEYNMTSGGEGMWDASPVYRQRMSISMKNSPRAIAHRKKLTELPRSEEYREHQRKIMKESCANKTQLMKLHFAMRGIPKTPEHRKKLSESRKGFHHSEESKEKMRAAKKKRYALIVQN